MTDRPSCKFSIPVSCISKLLKLLVAISFVYLPPSLSPYSLWRSFSIPLICLSPLLSFLLLFQVKSVQVNGAWSALLKENKNKHFQPDTNYVIWTFCVVHTLFTWKRCYWKFKSSGMLRRVRTLLLTTRRDTACQKTWMMASGIANISEKCCKMTSCNNGNGFWIHDKCVCVCVCVYRGRFI